MIEIFNSDYWFGGFIFRRINVDQLISTLQDGYNILEFSSCLIHWNHGENSMKIGAWKPPNKNGFSFMVLEQKYVIRWVLESIVIWRTIGILISMDSLELFIWVRCYTLCGFILWKVNSRGACNARARSELCFRWKKYFPFSFHRP